MTFSSLEREGEWVGGWVWGENCLPVSRNITALWDNINSAEFVPCRDTVSSSHKQFLNHGNNREGNFLESAKGVLKHCPLLRPRSYRVPLDKYWSGSMVYTPVL